jgi:two-component sensor histidine kinase
MLRSKRSLESFYDHIWQEVQRTGSWQGEGWHQRKNSEDFPERSTITAVRNAHGQVTHYVGFLTDISNEKQQEQQRLRDEVAHRNTLVREVHHRIKNNLQGIMGILRKFANRHPEMAEPMQQAISQVQTISVIHGLQGRAVTASVLLCELLRAIAGEIETLWLTPVVLDIAPEWALHVVAEEEAVPIALVLNELILNAVKHGGQANGKVHITLKQGLQPEQVHIVIANAGHFVEDRRRVGQAHSGLHLITALMPHSGARIFREQHVDQVTTVLELEFPVIFPEKKEAKCQTHNQTPPVNGCSS